VSELTGQPVAKPGRSLTGFYVGLGVVTVLVGLGAWLWRPMRAVYLEKEVRKFQGDIEYMHGGRSMSGCWMIFLAPPGDAARWENGTDYGGIELPIDKLVRMGPVARPALTRLLRDPEPRLRRLTIVTLGEAKPGWATDLMVEASRDPDDKVAAAAAWAMEEFSGLRLVNSRSGARPAEPEIERCRQSFLHWWGSEGRTKRGGDRK